MSPFREVTLPENTSDETELLISWLNYLHAAVAHKLDGLSDAEARWRPDGHLISLVGIVNHLTNVEWRWIDGGMFGHEVSRSESEFVPGDELTATDALHAYEARASATDAAVRTIGSLHAPCGRREGTDLRWVLLQLINETARHAGHADAVRELLDGTTGD